MSIISFITKKLSLTGNKEKVARNVYWAILGKTANVLNGLVIGVLVARYLGPDDYGLMNYVISYVTLFTVIANFGLPTIEIRELARLNWPKEIILGSAFCIRSLLSLLAFGLIILTAFVFESDRFTIAMLSVYGISILFNPFRLIRNYFTAIVYNEYIVKSEVLRIGFAAAIKIVLLYLKLPLQWFIIASVFDFLLISTGYLYSYTIKIGNIFNWRFEKKCAKFLLKESFPMMLSFAAIIFYTKIDQILVRNMLDNEALGLFSVASKIIELGIFLPMIISQTISPLLVKEFQNNLNEYKLKRLFFLDIMFLISLLISLLLSLSANIAVNVLFGEKYLAAIPVLQIMAWKIVFSSMQNSSGQIIILEGQQKLESLRNIFGLAVCVGFNYLLIPKFGLKGAAYSTILTFFMAGFISHLLIPKYRYLFNLQLDVFIRSWGRTFNLIFKK